MTAPPSQDPSRTLGHADFVPRTLAKRFLTENVFESFTAAVHGASSWINDHHVDVVNVETVVLPNMHREDGSTDPALRTSGEMSSRWYQFVRVWYWHHG